MSAHWNPSQSHTCHTWYVPVPEGAHRHLISGEKSKVWNIRRRCTRYQKVWMHRAFGFVLVKVRKVCLKYIRSSHHPLATYLWSLCILCRHAWACGLSCCPRASAITRGGWCSCILYHMQACVNTIRKSGYIGHLYLFSSESTTHN